METFLTSSRWNKHDDLMATFRMSILAKMMSLSAWKRWRWEQPPVQSGAMFVQATRRRRCRQEKDLKGMPARAPWRPPLLRGAQTCADEGLWRE